MSLTNPYPSLAPDVTVLSIAQAIQQYDPRTPRHPLIWVEGEISDLSRANSGHSYFTLSDGRDQIACALWKGVARSLPVRVQDGLLVAVHCWVQTSPKGGNLELDIRNVVVQSANGPRRVALNELEAKLHAEGLLDPSRKRALPPQPTSIGVVTSPAGNVIHDITRIIQRRAPGVQIQLAPARVSGEGAAAEIAEAIRSLGRSGGANPIIVARGGGSACDLDAFNAEVVARAITESPVPIISAIGHEPDITIADLVADVRCATPSEAAEIAVPELSRHVAPIEHLEIQLRLGDASVVVRLPATASAPPSLPSSPAISRP